MIQPKVQPTSPEPVVEEPKIEEMVAPVINMPDEPTPDNHDSLELVFRMPLSGERMRRRFLKDDTVSLLYDYIDDLQNQKKCEFEGV